MDAEDWDDRYRGTELVWGAGPNRFLRAEVEDLPPGRALDLACGEGRNAVWLASVGWDVTGLDFSAVALDKAARLAESRGVTGVWERVDLADWSPSEEYDLVVVAYLQVPAPLRRRVMAAAVSALAPGATLLVVGHDLRNLSDGVGGPQDPGVLYTADDLSRDVAEADPTLTVERAGEVRRPVTTPDGDVDAIDCLLRARRPDDR